MLGATTPRRAVRRSRRRKAFVPVGAHGGRQSIKVKRSIGEGLAMASLRDTLDRFRPAATPGAPGRRGVPADRAAERASELAPLFEALAATERDAEEIRRRGAAEADRVRQDAHRRAEALVAEARVRAEASRADAAARARASADLERERARTDAARVAEQRARAALEVLPGLVARATELARNALAEAGRS